jgi:hypothetical protein
MLQSRLKRVYHFNSHMADSPMSVSWSPRSRRPSHVGHNSRCSRPRRSGAACLGGAIFPLPSSSLAGKPPVRMPILNWLTSNSDIGAAKRVPHRRPEEAPGLSAGDPNTGNIFIQGDNLEALKALLPFYARQVKWICIDPPDNTARLRALRRQSRTHANGS